MADSFQSEVPKARINLKLDLHTGGASKKTELPLKLLVTGDFSNGQESAPLRANRMTWWWSWHSRCCGRTAAIA